MPRNTLKSAVVVTSPRDRNKNWPAPKRSGAGQESNCYAGSNNDGILLLPIAMIVIVVMILIREDGPISRTEKEFRGPVAVKVKVKKAE